MMTRHLGTRRGRGGGGGVQVGYSLDGVLVVCHTVHDQLRPLLDVEKGGDRDLEAEAIEELRPHLSLFGVAAADLHGQEFTRGSEGTGTRTGIATREGPRTGTQTGTGTGTGSGRGTETGS